MITTQEWQALDTYKKYNAIEDETGNRVRLTREKNGDSSNGFIYAKGKQRRGWRYSEEYVKANYTLVKSTPKDADAKWHKNIERALKALNASGLWPELVPYLENLKKLTLEDKEKIYQADNKFSWEHHLSYPITEEAVIEHNKLFNQVFAEWIEKYPFMFHSDNEHGLMRVDCNYIWEKSEVQLKSMYFGKWYNRDYKVEIQKHIEERTECSFFARTSYDVSFHYAPDKKNAAWYSEEYKGCGNGHYYIALDHNTAWFMEND